jgi:hypothetical protein
LVLHHDDDDVAMAGASMAMAEADHVAANGMARKRAAQSQIDTILSMTGP